MHDNESDMVTLFDATYRLIFQYPVSPKKPVSMSDERKSIVLTHTNDGDVFQAKLSSWRNARIQHDLMFPRVITNMVRDRCKLQTGALDCLFKLRIPFYKASTITCKRIHIVQIFGMGN